MFGAYICALVWSTFDGQVGAVLAEAERLLDVGRRRLSHRIGDGAVADPVVAAADLRRRPLHLHLLVVGQREEIDRALARLGDEVGRDAVAGHHEEAGVAAGCVDLARHLALLGVAAASQRRQIDGGDRHVPPWRTFLLVQAIALEL